MCFLRVRHRRHVHDGAIGQSKRSRLRKTRIELLSPIALEIDRIDEVEPHAIGNRVDNAIDHAVGLFGHPAVNRIHRGRGGKVQCRYAGVIVGVIRIEERLQHAIALLVPDRVGDLELHMRIELAQQADQAAIRLIDLGDAHAVELQRGAHRVFCCSGRTVVRHGKCHRHRQRRHEQILQGIPGVRGRLFE